MATCGLEPHGREGSIGTTRPDQARGCSISRWVDQPAPIEVQADEVGAEHSPLHRHMTLAHWHTEVYHWHTCATEVCQTKSSRSGLKVTAHRVSARSEEVAKSWHTGTPKSHQPCFTARPCRRRGVSQGVWRSLGLRLFFVFSVKNEDVGVPVCQPRDDLRR